MVCSEAGPRAPATERAGRLRLTGAWRSAEFLSFVLGRYRPSALPPVRDGSVVVLVGVLRRTLTVLYAALISEPIRL
jgi:hypothetical protein